MLAVFAWSSAARREVRWLGAGKHTDGAQQKLNEQEPPYLAVDEDFDHFLASTA
jgi:hypothetical protein